MEHITSRKNKIICSLKRLGTDGAYRRETGEFLCDGEKLLQEALRWDANVTCVLWGGEKTAALPNGVAEYSCPLELMQSVSPLKSSHGPVFSVKIPDYNKAQSAEGNFLAADGEGGDLPVSSAIVLENVQDPGNVGTVIRTANAMGTGLVILVGECADLYNPKTVRATMGAIFRQRIMEMSIQELKKYTNQNKLHLYGAAVSNGARDIRELDAKALAVAIGSEGRGLSQELISVCEGQLVIPMQPGCESLNAAVAASIVMWEMFKNK